MNFYQLRFFFRLFLISIAGTTVGGTMFSDIKNAIAQNDMVPSRPNFVWKQPAHLRQATELTEKTVDRALDAHRESYFRERHSGSRSNNMDKETDVRMRSLTTFVDKQGVTEKSADFGNSISSWFDSAFQSNSETTDTNNLDAKNSDSANSDLANESSESLKLPARTSSRKPNGFSGFVPKSLGNAGIGLVAVLGLFFIVVWMSRKGKPKQFSGIPGDVVQVLGRAPLNQKQQLQLVRLGEKIILLAASSTSIETISEIDDPDEVDAITEVCLSNNRQKMRETFRQTLARVRTERMR